MGPPYRDLEVRHKLFHACIQPYCTFFGRGALNQSVGGHFKSASPILRHRVNVPSSVFEVTLQLYREPTSDSLLDWCWDFMGGSTWMCSTTRLNSSFLNVTFLPFFREPFSGSSTEHATFSEPRRADRWGRAAKFVLDWTGKGWQWWCCYL